MAHVDFTIKSNFKRKMDKLVISTNAQKELTILKNEPGIPKKNEEKFSLKPGDELCIQVKQNGNIIDLRNELYIQISPLDGLNCELSTTETEIKLKLPKDLEIARNYSVTVGAGNPG